MYWTAKEIPNPKKRPKKKDPKLILLSIAQLNNPTFVDDSEFWLRSPQILVSQDPWMSSGQTRLTAEFWLHVHELLLPMLILLWGPTLGYL